MTQIEVIEMTIVNMQVILLKGAEPDFSFPDLSLLVVEFFRGLELFPVAVAFPAEVLWSGLEVEPGPDVDVASFLLVIVVVSPCTPTCWLLWKEFE